MSISSRPRRPIWTTSCDWRTATAGADGYAVWLGLGTNLGDRRANLAAGVRGLAELGRIEAISSVYASEPVGVREQPEFWNLVVRLRTRLNAETLLSATQRLEVLVGRRPTFSQGPRILDIDILLFDARVIDRPGLRVPHPHMLERAFVLRPLTELDPDVRHPESGERLSDRLAAGTFERTERLFPGSGLLEEP